MILNDMTSFGFVLLSLRKPFKINSLTRQHDSHKTFCESYTLLHNHLCSAMKARHLIVYTKVQVFSNQHVFLLFPLFHLKGRIFKTFKYLQMKISSLNPMLKQHVKNKHVHIIFYYMQKHETTCYIHVSKQVHFIYVAYNEIRKEVFPNKYTWYTSPILQ